jgi:hypothetical protein
MGIVPENQQEAYNDLTFHRISFKRNKMTVIVIRFLNVLVLISYYLLISLCKAI